MKAFSPGRVAVAVAAAAALGGLGFVGLHPASTRAAEGASTSTSAYKPVTSERLLAGAADDGWVMYRKSYDGRGFAPFDSINAKNVSQLKTVFTTDTGQQC